MLYTNHEYKEAKIMNKNNEDITDKSYTLIVRITEIQEQLIITFRADIPSALYEKEKNLYLTNLPYEKVINLYSYHFFAGQERAIFRGQDNYYIHPSNQKIRR